MIKNLFPKRSWLWVRSLWVVVFLIFQIGFVNNPPVHAQSSPGTVSRIRAIEADKSGLLHPAGLAYAGQANAWLVVETSGTGASGTDVVSLDAAGRQAGVVHLSGAADPLNLAYDNATGQLIFLQLAAQQLVVVPTGADGALNSAGAVSYSAAPFGVADPQGMTVDPASGALLILDGAGPRIVRVQPGSGGDFAAAAVSSLGLQSSGLANPSGIALDPTTGHIQLYNPADQTLVELTQAGQVVTTRDLAGYGLRAPQALVFAPSGDQTDDPAVMNLYLADSGTAGMDGQIVEFSLAANGAGTLTTAGANSLAPAAVSPAAIVPNAFAASLVKTTDMAAITPPSPDPSGIAYLPGSNTLLVSDGEVEETVNGISHFQKANLWEMNLDGSVKRTANISTRGSAPVPVTNEPTGVALNTKTGHFYFTDDNQLAVYDVNPGQDGTIGTADDTYTSFSVAPYGNNDPEGIAYDSQNNRLFVADGVNREIYQYSLSGTLISHFDVAVIGARDPETVEYNPDSGTLYVMNSNAANIRIFEVSLSGALLQTITTTVPGLAPAGLAYAPASDGSGEMHFYVVDRGIDNNVDPNIIDGKLHELTAPPVIKPVNTAPTVSAGANQIVTLANGKASAALNGSASDDGLPNPPAAISTTWSKISGPGTVSFASASAVATTATFSASGVYVLRLTANDGALSSSSDVTITVNSAPSVNAGADQTITLAQGTVSTTLQGTAADDGLPNPPGAVSVTWSKVSGPGTVSFGTPNAVESTAAFDKAGSYVLRLSASDGALSASSEVTITVNAPVTLPPKMIYLPMLVKQ